MNSTPFRRACFRFLRYAAWTAIIVFTLVTSLYLYLDWRAEKRWSETVAMLKREGETLTLTDLLPPRLLESENYAALPELRGINIIEDGDETKGASGARRRALHDLINGLQVSTPKMYQGSTLGRSPDWSRIMAGLKTAHFITNLPPAGKEAEVCKVAIETGKPLLRVLSEASRSFQDAEWVPALRDQTLPKYLALPMPHYNAVLRICQALALHAVAAAESGDTKGALDGCRTIFLLSKAMDREPFIIGHWVSLMNNQYGFEIVWSLLRQRKLKEADLTSLQTLLAAYLPEESYLLSLRGGLIIGLSWLDALAADPTGLEIFNLAGATAKKGDLRALIGLAVPDSFYTESGATWVELKMTHFILPMKTGGTWSVIRQQEALIEELGGGPLFDPPYDRFLARRDLPSAMQIAHSTLHMEAMRRQAIAACALERFFFKHARYPEQLDELVPQFLASVPLDPVDQEPLRYRRTDSGRYRIWCVGMDGADDEGQVNPGPGDNPSAILSKPDYQGDRTWQYVPVEEPQPAPSGRPRVLVPIGN